MRIRTIKPDFFKHDGIAKLAPLHRLLFVGLWCMADCEGRLEDRPQRIKVEILPYDDLDIEAALTALVAGGFITRYRVNDLSVIAVNSFRTHQRITGKEAESSSKLPAPEAPKKRASRGKQPGNTGETTETTGREGKGKEGKGREEKETKESAAPSGAACSSPEIPLLLNTPEFLAVWNRWMAIRAKGKKPKTPLNELFAEQLRWLERLGTVEEAIESVSASIRNGWQGLFDQRGKGSPSRPHTLGHAEHVPDSVHAKGFFHRLDQDSAMRAATSPKTQTP